MLKVAAKKQRGAFLLDAKFELPTPGVVALFGRSGCGKTTLVNVIAGLLTADLGRVALDDTVLLDTDRGVNVPPEKRRIGYVFQDARLFPHLRVEANLRYALKRAAVAPFVGVDRVVELLDLEPLMSRRTHELSGGERQRVAIGRALLSQPSLLLLDEPLASLDASRREEVLPYLETLRDQLSIPMVYVSHDFDEVLRLATHLVLMESGKTIAQGNLSEMSLNPGVRAIIGADWLIYQDLTDLVHAVRHDNAKIKDFDTSCFSGEYVTGDVTPEYLKRLQGERSDEAKQQRRDASNRGHKSVHTL